MNKDNLKRIVFTTISMWFILQAASAQDTLVLYTRATCSNCKAVKQTLIENQVKFIEKEISYPINAIEMLKKLKSLRYRNEIELPVIFLNNKLLHPAYQTESGLVQSDIAIVTDSLLAMQERDQLHSVSGVVPSRREMPPAYVIVVAEFKDEVEARRRASALIGAGFNFAGVVFVNGIYKVYNKFFLKRDLAEEEQKNAKGLFPNCYLLSITQ